MWSYTTTSANGLWINIDSRRNEGRETLLHVMLKTQNMYRQQNMKLTFETLLCQKKQLVQYTTSATFDEGAYVHTTHM